jgi:RNA exonuclease 1
MFPSTRFKTIACPMVNCQRRQLCLFSHDISITTDNKKRKFGGEEHTKPKINKPTISPVNAKVQLRPEPFTIKPRPEPITIKPTLKSIATKRKEPQVPIGSEAPIISADFNSKIPIKSRQKVITLIHTEFMKIYQNLPPQIDIAYSHSLEQELKIHSNATAITYNNLAMGVLMRLRKRKFASNIGNSAKDLLDIGIDGVYKPKLEIKVPTFDLEKLIIDPEFWKDCFPNKEYFNNEVFDTWNRPVNPKNNPNDSNVNTLLISIDPLMKTCDRCAQKYNPSDESGDECVYHFGRVYKKIYQCCKEAATGTGCTVGKHVFKQNPKDQEKLLDFKFLSNTSGQYNVVAFDCEMGYTTNGMEIIRISIIDWNRTVLYDRLVRPKGEVVCLNERFSGIKSLEDAEKITGSICVSFEEVWTFLESSFGRDTIFIGHGLENDLFALGKWLCYDGHTFV